MSDTMKSWDLFEGFSRYQRDVMRTMPKFERRESMCNAALGLAGEAGEAAEIIKKVLFQGHPLDKEQIKKELGDVAFYLTYCGILLDIDLSEIIEANVLKRLERFPDGFSPNASRAPASAGRINEIPHLCRRTKAGTRNSVFPLGARRFRLHASTSSSNHFSRAESAPLSWHCRLAMTPILGSPSTSVPIRQGASRRVASL